MTYSWPGNVRELENAVERLVVTHPGMTIGCDDLPAAQGGQYEYRVLRIPATTSRNDARRMLTEHAEFGRWELARTLLFAGGERKVVAAAQDHPRAQHPARRRRLTRQQVRRSRSSTRVPKRSASTGTRSSTPWNMPAKSRSAGSRSGAKP